MSLSGFSASFQIQLIQVMMQYKQISVQYNLAFSDLSFTDMHGEYIAVCWLQVDYQNPT